MLSLCVYNYLGMLYMDLLLCLTSTFSFCLVWPLLFVLHACMLAVVLSPLSDRKKKTESRHWKINQEILYLNVLWSSSHEEKVLKLLNNWNNRIGMR